MLVLVESYFFHACRVHAALLRPPQLLLEAPCRRLRHACLWLVAIWQRSLEDVVLEEPVLDPAVWEAHHSSSVLDALVPLAFVDGAVCPVHLSVAHALVVEVVAVVDVAALPDEGAVAVLFVELVLALELIALGVVGHLLPLAFAVLHAVFELAGVDAAVPPLVDTFAFGLAVLVLT